MALDLSHLTDEDAEPIQAFVAKMEEAAAERDAEVADLKATIEGEDEKDLLPDDLPEPVAKALADRDVLIAKANEEAASARADAAAVRDERDTEKYDAIAAGLENVLGTGMGPILKNLANSNAPDDYKTLEDALGKIIKWDGMAELLRERGDNAANGSAVDQIAVFAKENQKEDRDLSYADAKTMAWSDHPELKAQYREEGN